MAETAEQKPKTQEAKSAPHQATDAELRDITEDVSALDQELTEKHGFAWSQKTRLVLAIFLVFLSAIILWWMVS